MRYYKAQKTIVLVVPATSREEARRKMTERAAAEIEKMKKTFSVAPEEITEMEDPTIETRATTSTSGTTIDDKVIKEAIEMLEKMPDRISVTKVDHNSRIIREYYSKNAAAAEAWLYGMPLCENKMLPPGVVRIHYSDGRIVNMKMAEHAKLN